MLRELNENEMEMVSGGTGDGTRGKSGDAKYRVANRETANAIDAAADACPAGYPYSIEGHGACFATLDQANAASASVSSVPDNNDPNRERYESEGWTYHYDTQNGTWARSRTSDDGVTVTITGHVRIG